MQANPRVPNPQAPVKIYNAVYSSVQVYECMVRGIAVMRRRSDSYVNATQILKVAGVDKGRRTKILEKEILPGKHEIVQGGYGKYQGTWIPLERGRDIAIQYGVAPLLAPLFDFVPAPNPMGGLPPGLQAMGGTAMPRPMHPGSAYAALAPAGYGPGGLAPPPIMPGSALRLLNQGRAQGLFTPSTSTLALTRQPGYASPSPYFPGYPAYALPGIAPTPPPPSNVMQQPPASMLKRTRSDADGDVVMGNTPQQQPQQSQMGLAAAPDIRMADTSRPASTVSQDAEGSTRPPTPSGATQRPTSIAPLNANGQTRPQSAQGAPATNGKPPQGADEFTTTPRMSTRPSLARTGDLMMPTKDLKRGVVYQTLYQRDDPKSVLDVLHDLPADNKDLRWDVDLVLDEVGHTALHFAASMARPETVKALIAAGADVHRGNFDGETPLIRAALATENYHAQSFDKIVAALHASIRTLDNSHKTVLHHIAAFAGVQGRSSIARYYLEQIFYWIAQHQNGDFKTIIDLQDVHGDTALNVAARVGNRALVRNLLDVGANRVLANKLGLRPGDFGVETEELNVGPREDDVLVSLRAPPSVPVQKSKAVMNDLREMVEGLASEFAAEIKTKQDALDLQQTHLRAATRQLAEQRKQIQIWQAECSELDLVQQRTKNLEKAAQDEDGFDWTGRTELDGSDGAPVGGPAFRKNISAPTNGGPGPTPMDTSTKDEEDPMIPSSDTAESLIRLRRLKLWHDRVEKLMEQRLKKLQGASAEREFQCKKIVSLCTGVPLDKVEDMLQDLVIAVESDSHINDISRVSGFMQRVRTLTSGDIDAERLGRTGIRTGR